MNFENFSERLNYALKVLRKKNQSWLQEQTGISMGLISNYCLGKNKADQSKAVNIAEALNVSFEWLYAGVGEMGEFNKERIYEGAYSELSQEKSVAFKLKKSTRKSITFSFTFSRRELNDMLPKLVEMMST